MSERPDLAEYYERVEEAAGVLGERAGRPPAVGIVLGSGLGAFADRLQEARTIPYGDLPHWPPSGVAGHDGRAVIGTLQGRGIVALAGRCHVYEGYSLPTVTFAVRALGRLGVRTLILTNAAGGIRDGLEPGALMVIDDHINLTGSNPLIGPNDARFGPRFPDMSQVYSPRLRTVADEAALRAGVPVVHGIYAGVAGPSYETPAEIRYLRTIGADAVGMSTVPEALAARHMGLEVLGLSCITNMAAGIRPAPLDHADVVDAGRRARGAFSALLEEIIGRL